MQEPCLERQCEAAGPPLERPLESPAPEPPSWTPEQFLQSTLHEGKGAVRLTPASEDKKGPRGRRKPQWKLKFHHQALPPEYLDHYEASLCKSRPMAAPTPPAASPAPQGDQTPQHFFNTLPNESIRNWLQRITRIKNDLSPPPNTSFQPAPSRRRKPPLPQTETSAAPVPPKVVNYRDLPYMGEMTLNNSKPRRGRKPKKADICHLIYKNYGTIFPGTPGHLVDERANGTGLDKNIQIKKEKGDKSDALITPSKQKTDLQNKIISSLLEKRLSQENKKHKEVKIKKHKNVHVEHNDDHSASVPLRLQASSPSSPSLASPSSPSLASTSLTEPLNLCVRDLNNLKIRLLRKHGNVYAKANVETKTEPDRSDHEIDNCEDEKSVDPLPGTSAPDSVSPRMNVPDFKKALQEAASSGDSDVSGGGKADPGAESPLPGGYVYWPNAGVFVHPLALQSQLLYYQGLAAGSSYTLPPDSGSPEIPPSVKLDRNTPLPFESEQRSSPGASSEGSAVGARVKRVPSSNRGSCGAPAKRKRSAIFIPPMPSDTGSSPATEVSICKFKFTGGARPSLQEKKMLSVDSGGNFRYYSGTGDKANRGYEFSRGAAPLAGPRRVAAVNQSGARYLSKVQKTSIS